MMFFNKPLTASQVAGIAAREVTNSTIKSAEEVNLENIIIDENEEKVTKKNKNKITTSKDDYSANQNVHKDFAIDIKAKSKNGKITGKSDSKYVTYKNGKIVVKKNFIGNVTVTLSVKEDDKYGAASKKIKVTVLPASTSITSEKIKDKTISIGCKKIPGISGYEISYSTNKNFKNSSKKETTKTSYVLKNLKNKQSYYVRIRTYKKIDKKKLYSAYSKSIIVKITSK